MKVYIEYKGKVGMKYKYIPLLDVEIESGKTLNDYLEQNEKEKQELRKEIKVLKKALANVIGAVGGVDNEEIS